MLVRALGILLLTSSLTAQEADPVLARLPSDTTNLVVVHDVMPHVEALLASKTVGEVLAASGDIQEGLFGMRLDAARLRRQLELVRAFVPTEIVVAGTDDTVAALSQWADLAGIGILPWVGGDDAEIVKDVQDAALAALRGLRSPTLVAWIRMRDERTAEGWFDSAVEALDKAPREGLEVATEDTKVTLRIAPLRVAGGTLRKVLERSGVAVPADVDPRLVVCLEQRGAELELRIAEPKAGPLAPLRLGRLWVPGPTQAGFARIDVGEASEAVSDTMERWWGIAAAIQDEELAGRLHRLLANLDGLLVPTTTRVVVDEGVVWTHEVEFDDGVTEVESPSRAVLRCIDRDAGPFLLSAMSLDVELASACDTVIMQAAARGLDLPEALGSIAEFLAGEESAVFGAGTLVVSRPAKFRGAKKWQLPELPFGAIALVAQAHDAESAVAFMRELAGHLAAGLGIEGAPWIERDLGVGVPTQALDLERCLPGWGEAGIDADFAPHWAVVDSVLVLSTDPALSRELVTRIRGKVMPTLPAKVVIDWLRWSGDHWADACAGAAKWLRATPGGAIGAHAHELELVLDGCAAIFRATDGIETVTDLDGNVLREVTSVRWRKKQ